MAFEPTPHPIYRIPTLADIKACAAKESINAEKAYILLHTKREEAIKLERMDPLQFGWEPAIWRICDCLLGLPWIPPDEAERVRKELGFNKAIRVLLILGGNRSGKSEYAAKRTMLLLLYKRESKAWVFHTSQQMSIEYQQKLLFKYMPADLKHKPIMTASTYIAYKFKTGFSENSFTLPNLSWCSFRNYSQDIETLEGGELDVLWDDEIVPVDWLQTQMLRLATRNGVGIVTYTPVQGYTGVVKEFIDGSARARGKIGWLLPTDGGAWAEDLAVKNDKTVDIMNSVIGPEKTVKASGREWEVVPRIVRCPMDPRKGVVFFNPSDNPFGNPTEVINIVRPEPRWFVKERFYGIGNKLITAKFPKFNQAVHCIPDELIPKEGSTYLMVDPCGGRNWFMGWIRACPDGSHYFVKEWPGDYEIPGIGHPGKWAEPSGKIDQVDGRRGGAQKSFGFGLMAYKKEIARIEQWLYEKDQTEQPLMQKPQMIVRKMGTRPPAPPAEILDRMAELWDTEPPAGMSMKDWVRSWKADGPARMRVMDRFMDSRYANTRTFGDEEPTTLLEELEEWELYFRPTTAGEKASSITEGCELINDMLYYDEEQELSFFNRPRLYIARSCKNLIYAMETWTGHDGKDAATKDPIDLLRYYFLLKCEYVKPETKTVYGGGHY